MLGRPEPAQIHLACSKARSITRNQETYFALFGTSAQTNIHSNLSDMSYYSTHDLCLPFDNSRDMGQYITRAEVKKEHDLPLPFSAKKKPRFVKAGKRGQQPRRLPARTRPLQRRHAGISSAASNRSARPKANVLVEVDCSRSQALERVVYLENKRQVFAKWSGSNQWWHNRVNFCTALSLHYFQLCLSGTCTMGWRILRCHG